MEQNLTQKVHFLRGTVKSKAPLRVQFLPALGGRRWERGNTTSEKAIGTGWTVAPPEEEESNWGGTILSM